MLVFSKLLIAHLLGDFMLQSDRLITKKRQYKLKSYHLYLHVTIHALLSFVLLWNWRYWYVIPSILISHFIIDVIKLYSTNTRNMRWAFILDQMAHLLILLLLTAYIVGLDLTDLTVFDPVLWPLLCCVLFLSMPVAILLKTFFTRWTLTEDDTGVYGLKNAGKWIGIIERLLIFVFIITDHFTAVGLLLTAKSVFRFGDLSKAKNMKLTEYVLIGTLLSFGTAILVGLLFKALFL